MFSARTRDALLLGPHRRRRRMLRALAELDRLDEGERSPHQAMPAVGRRQPRRRPGPRTWRRRLVAMALAVALTTTVSGIFAHRQFGATLTADGIRFPQRLGQPAEATGHGIFAFLNTHPGSHRPVTYDPCDPIKYVVNDTLMPAGAAGLLSSAVDEISAATGLVFEHEGPTNEIPRSRPALLPPARRRPVVIAWTTPDELPALIGRTAGVGGSTAEQHDFTGELRYVTGMVALDAPQLAEVIARPSGPAQVRAIIIHELGHLVGLDHVDDPGELMYADNVGRTELGPGDRQGLAELGSGRCYH